MAAVAGLWAAGVAARLAGVEAWVTMGGWMLLALASAFSVNRFQPKPRGSNRVLE